MLQFLISNTYYEIKIFKNAETEIPLLNTDNVNLGFYRKINIRNK